MTQPFFATQIIQQLGGQRFLAMTGARMLTYDRDNRGLHFTINGHNAAGARVNRVRITLMAGDTYCIATFSVRRLMVRAVDELDGVYADQLRDAFTRLTGLECTL